MRSPWQDYRDWKALGPGGLPHNALGWSLASGLRLLKRETTSTGMYGTDGRYSRVPPASPWTLAPRRGARPVIGRHPIPHRQLDQVPGDDGRERTRALVEDLVGNGSAGLTIARSRFERRGPAVFSTRPHRSAPWLRDAQGEIAHVHPSDGSLHVVVHPQDASILIRAGWAERHPLCGRAVLGLPPTYLLVYAPRDDAERATVRQVLQRAVAWA